MASSALKIACLPPLQTISEGEFVYGVLRHADGRRALVMVNHGTGYTAWPTVQFDAPEAAIKEIDPATGDAADPVDLFAQATGAEIGGRLTRGGLSLTAAAWALVAASSTSVNRISTCSWR